MEFAECSDVKDFRKIYVEKKQKKSVFMILLKRTLYDKEQTKKLSKLLTINSRFVDENNSLYGSRLRR